MNRKWVAPLLLVLTIVLFHWKLWLTNQYTWLESPDLMSQVLPSSEFSSYELHHGRLPLWDPYTPMHATMQASLAYPPHRLLLAASCRAILTACGLPGPARFENYKYLRSCLWSSPASTGGSC